MLLALTPPPWQALLFSPTKLTPDSSGIIPYPWAVPPPCPSCLHPPLPLPTPAPPPPPYHHALSSLPP